MHTAPVTQPSPTTDLERYVAVGGVRTRYRVSPATGSGTPLLLVHGIGRSLEDWSDNVEALARGRAVYALDMVGFGRTDKPDRGYSLDDLSDFLLEFMNTVGLGRAVLIGNSLGGAVCVRSALRVGSRVAGLVLVAPAGFGQRIAPLLSLCTVPVLGEYLTRNSAKIDGARMVLQGCFHDQAFVTPERIEHDHRLSTLPGRQRAFWRTLRDACDWRGVRQKNLETVRGQLSNLTQPTLVVWGEHDHILPSQYLEGASRVQGIETQRFESCGHFPQLECSQRFNALTLDFLKRRKL